MGNVLQFNRSAAPKPETHSKPDALFIEEAQGRGAVVADATSLAMRGTFAESPQVMLPEDVPADLRPRAVPHLLNNVVEMPAAAPAISPSDAQYNYGEVPRAA